MCLGCYIEVSCRGVYFLLILVNPLQLACIFTIPLKVYILFIFTMKGETMTQPEPFKIKMVEHLKVLTREERETLLKERGYNVFKLKAEDVFIDLLTDSGTTAMSDEQWGAMFTAQQSYAGGNSFYQLERAVNELFGFDRFVTVHQGRAAENVLFSVMLSGKTVVPNNMHFDTTKANVQHKGGKPLNLVVDDAYDTGTHHDFKGNMDTEKLKKVISEEDNIPLIMLTVTNNTAGGQAVSMENIREVSKIAKENNIPFFLDACRFAENSYFIKKREKGYEDKSIREIVREMFSYADGFTFSAKKDGLTNSGGIIGMRDEDLQRRCTELAIIVEGYPTYGGLACRDLSAIAKGLYESTTLSYLDYRSGQVEHLAGLLRDAGVPIVEPPGGHAVFIDGRRFLPHIPPEEFPAQALTASLYIEGGIRGVELGTCAFGDTDDNGNMIPAPFDNMRLAIPRRVYTLNQLKYVAEQVISLYEKRDEIRGMERTYSPKLLGHFMSEFRFL